MFSFSLVSSYFLISFFCSFFYFFFFFYESSLSESESESDESFSESESSFFLVSDFLALAVANDVEL
jgi:hypothetical protein